MFICKVLGVTSSSESIWSSDLLPLEGAKSCFQSYFDFLANDGKFVVPNKQKRVEYHLQTVYGSVEVHMYSREYHDSQPDA